MAAGQQQKKAPGGALTLMAKRIAVAPVELEQTLKQTVFKDASPAEFLVLVALANKYDLDPFAKEIYAFSKKGGGIVPLVPIDGWLKIIHNHPDFDGMSVAFAEEMVKPGPAAKECPQYVDVTIYHKSTPERPTVHREWIDECYVASAGPWNSHTKRMLRWKGIIQTGREAFGLGGIYDPDEAERISDAEVIEGAIEEEVELVGDDWDLLVKKVEALGFTEADIMANAGALLYEGPGREMPREIANQIYFAMQASPAEEPGGKADPEAQQAAGDAGGAADGQGAAEGQEALTHQQKRDQRAEEAAAEKSPSEMAEELRAKVAARELAKPIAAGDVNWIATQCTVHHVEDEELLEWLGDEVGVDAVEKIPAVRLEDVKAFITAHPAASAP